MKKKIWFSVIMILLIGNICGTAIMGMKVIKMEDESKKETTQYVMYIGTNDKDTYTQLIPTEEAKKKIDEICFKYLEGYTIQDAEGSW